MDTINAAVDSDNDEMLHNVPLQPYDNVILISDSDVESCDREDNVKQTSLDDVKAVPDSDVELRYDVISDAHTSSKVPDMFDMFVLRANALQLACTLYV